MLQVIKKIAVRTFLAVLILVVVVIVGTLLALQTSPVQTWLAGKATDWVSEKLGFPVSIGKVDVHWVDHASFRDVVIQDAEHNRMIDVPELDVDFHFTTLLQGRDINLDDVFLNGARVRLIKSPKTNTLNIDDFILAVNNLTATGDTTRSRRPPVFSIDHVTLNNVLFSYNDQRKDSITDGFDYQHFVVDSINASANNFRLVADTIEIDIKKLSGVNPQTRLDVKKLQAFFRYTRHQMLLSKLHARVGNSYIADSVVFRYDRAADLSDFNNKVSILAHLEKTRIYAKDLALFAPYLNRYEEYWFVTGDFNGKVTRFRLRNADLAFGRRSAIRGNISFTGLPDFNNAFIDFDLQPSVLVAGDLRQYVPGEEAYATVRKFGTVKLRGKFLGFPKDFVANGSFDTDLGKVVSDINLKIKDNPARSSYKGRLVTTGFDIGTLSGQPELVQRLDMNGQVEGTGFTVETAALRVNATARRIGVKGYNYRNLTMNGKLSRQQFSGTLMVNDTNLVVSAEGEVDLRNGQKLINVRANLRRADLQALNLTERQVTVSSQIDLNVQGLERDDITG
ncbi:MAG TPA: AsmA family protein, partial [Cytophagales bacterium]